jgi:hypothetical protein
MRAMTRLHFMNGLLISTLAFVAACSSSSTPSKTTGDGGGSGGASSGSGGATGSGGGSSSGGATGSGGGSSSGGKTGSGGASSSGGKSGSGGASSSGGATGDSGTVSPACKGYCDDEASLCTFTGANKQFPDRTSCETACATFVTTGDHTAQMGNTLWCRINHLGNIKAALTDANRATHCPHTGTSPTMYCL